MEFVLGTETNFRRLRRRVSDGWRITKDTSRAWLSRISDFPFVLSKTASKLCDVKRQINEKPSLHLGRRKMRLNSECCL